jgi:SacI homology domain
LLSVGPPAGVDFGLLEAEGRHPLPGTRLRADRKCVSASNRPLFLKPTLGRARVGCPARRWQHSVPQQPWASGWRPRHELVYLLRGAAAQGVVEGRTLVDSAGRRFVLALFSRRSRLHPGMRYIARGLNALASPGNEIECEQIVWTIPTGACAARAGARSRAVEGAPCARDQTPGDSPDMGSGGAVAFVGPA